jgi:poly(hydroxyalkanoate) depolymerase family esterase
MNNSLQNLMRRATRLTQSGRLNEAVQAIQRALGRRTAAPTATRARGGPATGAAFFDPLAHQPSAVVLDGCVVEIEPAVADSPAPTRPEVVKTPAPATGPGEFIASTIVESASTRAYKLYIPPAAAGRQLPLVVMLHGCTQNPDDFAAGTGMNAAAREQGFFVLYPAQSTEANPTGCWNWFKHSHQQRGRGEPALIAAMTKKIIAENAIDSRRVFVAGLSAGGAMAAIVGAEYPDLFAAVGVHSGLAAGAATNLPDALAAMRGGASGPLVNPLHRATAAGGPGPAAKALPTIVFHGDNDAMVHPRNGEAVIAAATSADFGAAGASPAARMRVEQGRSDAGRSYTRTVHSGRDGSVAAEHWLVHGAGHAWSGGNAAGTYTDASGPDATGEMLRFFFENPRRAGH